jgi:hypothetical protein
MLRFQVAILCGHGHEYIVHEVDAERVVYSEADNAVMFYAPLGDDERSVFTVSRDAVVFIRPSLLTAAAKC